MEEKKQENKTKKILHIVGDVVFGIFMVCVFLFAISNIIAKKNDGIPNLFGNGYLTIESDSMDGKQADSFKVGDLITVKTQTNETAVKLEVGDIITYNSQKYNKIVTHRIVDKSEFYSGDTLYVNFTTNGDKVMDYSPSLASTGEEIVRSDYVLAVYTGKVAGLGTTIKWFQSGLGFFVIVVLPTILFLIYELIQFIKTYMEVKGEQNKELSDAEKEKAKEDLKAELKAQLMEEMKEKEKLKEEMKAQLKAEMEAEAKAKVETVEETVTEETPAASEEDKKEEE